MIKTLSCWHYIFALTFLSTISCLSCTNPQGAEVSWFAAMKFPQKFLSSHAYLDNTGGSEFTIINNPIDDATALSALVRTIEKIKLVKNILAFNDDGAGTNGHMKGIIGYDEQSGTGVYIMHSIPKYPIIINGNIDTSLPPNAFANAQHVYCISLGAKVLAEVVDNIRYAKPHIKMRTGLFLNFIRVSSNLIKATSFSLLSGETQYFFTKSPSNYAHIYDDIVGPGLGTSLIINTFLPGRSPPLPDQDIDPLSASSALSAPLALPAFSVLPGLDDLDLDLLLDPDIGLSSICGRRSFRNNVSIRFGDNHFWTFGSDHSKWAVSPDYERVKIACFCDLNRVCSQAKRGGSCLCLESPKLHAALLRTVEAPENCKKKFNNYGCPNPPKPSKPAAANIKFHPYLKK